MTGRESPERARARFERAAERNREAVEKHFGREAKQEFDMAEEAFREKQAIGGANVELRNLARKALGKGATEKEIDAAIAKLEEKGGFQQIEKGMESFTVSGGGRLGPMKTEKVIRDPTPEEANAIRVDRMLDRRLREGPQSPVIHYYENNRKMIVPGASEQERARVNGENAARDAERFP